MLEYEMKQKRQRYEFQVINDVMTLFSLIFFMNIFSILEKSIPIYTFGVLFFITLVRFIYRHIKYMTQLKLDTYKLDQNVY